MPEKSPFKQVDEKHVSAEVTCMRWSPKMDLIVVANVQAEVSKWEATKSRLWSGMEMILFLVVQFCW